MNTNKVIHELLVIMEDPFQNDIAHATIDRIENHSPIGKLLIHLLEKAENGDFK